MQQALITGAASGLGWQLTNEYLEAGWYVVLLDRDEQRLQECAAKLAQSNAACFDVACADVTDVNQLNDVVGSLQCVRDGLDLLINNAGITHRSQASVTDPDVFDKVMSVNWRAPVRLTQLCLPALRKRQGQVICMSSMAAWMPVPGRAAYGASKAALSLHFEAWRPELLKDGIRLLMIYPGFVETSIERNALGSDGQPTTRPRSAVGRIQSVEAAALAIVRAQGARHSRLYAPQWSSRIGRWLWLMAPAWFQRVMSRKFAVELETPKQ